MISKMCFVWATIGACLGISRTPPGASWTDLAVFWAAVRPSSANLELSLPSRAPLKPSCSYRQTSWASLKALAGPALAEIPEKPKRCIKHSLCSSCWRLGVVFGSLEASRVVLVACLPPWSACWSSYFVRSRPFKTMKCAPSLAIRRRGEGRHNTHSRMACGSIVCRSIPKLRARAQVPRKPAPGKARTAGLL